MLLTRCTFRLACDDSLCSLLDWYDVQPHSIYYPSEPADVIYFGGSTIEFTCDVFCQRNCQTRLLYNNSNGSFLLLRGNIFDAPLKFELNYFEHSKVTLRITNATASSAGSYQCLTEAWKNTYIVNKEATFRMAGMFPHILFTVLFDKLYCP